jgi:hypothetical protein
MTEPLDLNQAPGPKVAATPAAYNPTGSSIAPGSTVSPGGGYPSNPAEPPAINSGPAAGQPSQAESFAMGITLLSPCTTCGVAVMPQDMGLHSQQHGTGYFPEGSDFGSRNFSVDADLQTGRYSIGEQK